VTGLGRVFDAIVPGITASMERLYAGVKTWLVDKLGSTMTWVSDKAKAVGDAFFTLYDRVVGHSYVPDMVTEIGQHMAQLDAKMVQPAKAATAGTADAFRQLQDELRPIMERLYPEQARDNRLAADIALVEKNMRELGYTTEQVTDAVKRLTAERIGEQTGGVPGDIAVDDPGLSEAPVQRTLDGLMKRLDEAYPQIQAKNGELVKSFADTVRGVADAFGGLASAIRSGDALDVIQGILDGIAKIAPMFGGGSAGGSGGFGGFGLDGARASGGSVLPGGSYLVGERGPEILRMGGRGGTIVANDQIGAAAVVQLVVGPGQFFEPAVASISGNVSVQTVSGAQRTAARRGRARLA
jgi:hypothetical protein